jgi:hypothetical protein
MSGPAPATRRLARLNPFAFPSDTDFAFWLLIAAILGSSILLHLAVANAVLAGGESQTALNARCEKQATAQHPGLTLGERSAWVSIFNACETDSVASVLPAVLAGTAGLAVTSVALYLLIPALNARRRRLQPLTTDDAPEVVQELVALCREAGVRQPRFVWDPLNPASSGLAFGPPSRRHIALTGGLVTRYWTDSDAFRAVALHELAHLRNGDVDKAYLVVAVWWAFLATALGPYVLSLLIFSRSNLLATGLRVAALALLVYLLRNATLRSREVYADVRASTRPGIAAALDRLLPADPDTRLSRWRRLLGRHPSPALRRQVVRDPAPLFRVGFWIALGTGIAGAIAYPNVEAVVGLAFPGGSDASSWIAALLFGSLVVGVVGLGAWRASFAALARGELAPRTWLLAAGLGAGLALGELLSLSETVYVPAGFRLTGAALLMFDVVWYGLLLGGVTLFLRWVVGCASAWLEAMARRDSPRLAHLLGFIPAAVVLSVWLQYLFYLNSFRLVGGAIPAATVAQALSSAGFPVPVGDYLDAALALAFLLVLLATSPLFYVTAQLLWLVPLAPWLWRRGAAPALSASWALLDAGAERVESSRPLAALQPGPAALAGLAGGAVFGAIDLPVAAGLAALATDALAAWLGPGQAVLGLLVQAGVAVAVASWTRRLGAVHALFAAFVAGCTIAVIALAAAVLTLGPSALRVAGLPAAALSTYLNLSMMITLPLALMAAAFASWVRGLASVPGSAPVHP